MPKKALVEHHAHHIEAAHALPVEVGNVLILEVGHNHIVHTHCTARKAPTHVAFKEYIIKDAKAHRTPLLLPARAFPLFEG